MSIMSFNDLQKKCQYDISIYLFSCRLVWYHSIEQNCRYSISEHIPALLNRQVRSHHHKRSGPEFLRKISCRYVDHCQVYLGLDTLFLDIKNNKKVKCWVGQLWTVQVAGRTTSVLVVNSSAMHLIFQRPCRLLQRFSGPSFSKVLIID